MVMVRGWSLPSDADGLPPGFAVLQPPRADFMNDWASIAREWLDQLGVDLSGATTQTLLGVRYFEVKWRLLQPRRRRRVLWAKGLRCPDPLRPALEEIARRSESGEDLMPHTSRGPVLKQYSQDGLLFDWGLHHFHLGHVPCAEDPRFVERTKEVLFARVTADAVHMLDVLEHGRGVQPWAIKNLYEEVRRASLT